MTDRHRGGVMLKSLTCRFSFWDCGSTSVFLPARSFCSCGSVTSGSKAASCCRALSSSVADLLYSVASVLILSLSWESFRGYLNSVVWVKGRGAAKGRCGRKKKCVAPGICTREFVRRPRKMVVNEVEDVATVADIAKYV